jgi:hypothetical protein
MCQEAVRKLCNPSESCHVRKVARLLARPLIHPSAWKGNSTNFAITEFSELRVYGVLGSSAQARSWMSSITVPSSLNGYTTLVPAKDPSE